MVKPRQRQALAGLLVAIAGLVLWWQLSAVWSPGAATHATPRRAAKRDNGGKHAREMPPLVGLDRLDHRAGQSPAGHRDVFAFGAPAPSVVPPPDRSPVASLPAPPVRPPDPALSPPGALAGATAGMGAPTGLEFIGAVTAGTGTRVAALLTQDKQVVTGREGDVVAQRYRVAHIGDESVDIVDVISGREHRIRLGGK